MASTSANEILEGIKLRINELAAQRDAALESARNLSHRISDLESELADARKELHETRLDVEFLTVSYKIADTPEALAAARKKIADLIRKIDSAINLIRKDPADV